jgi:dTMP kinase
MNGKEGVFIVIEGSDGSGKGTQFKLLAERLRAVGYDIEIFDFPRYEEPSSHFVRKYLNGEYGNASNISPYTASLFFALDRYEAAPKIRKAMEQGKIVLSCRYVGSNMAHQGGKFTNSGEQRGFFIWEDGLEFQMLGIPRPTVNIFLRVPAQVSFDFISKKVKRSYTDKTHDQHEQDINHLKNSVETYDTLCRLFPKDFKEIECAPGGKLLSIADINDKIWKQIKPILPPKPPNAARDVIVQLDKEQNEQKRLENDHKPSQNINNLSTEKTTENKTLVIDIKKVSLLAVNRIQEIVGANCQVLLTEWGDEDKYNFYTPVSLSKKMQDSYKQSLEKMADLHKKMSASAKQAKNPKNIYKEINATTPISSLNTIKVTGDTAAITHLISLLRSCSLSEVRWIAEQLQAGANRQQPENFALNSQPQNVLEQKDALSKIASKNLAHNISAETSKVTLDSTWPRNEFELLLDALYPYSTSSRKDIAKELENWTYEQKSQALSAAFETENSPTLHEARYKWSVITDSSNFKELTNVLKVQELQSQPTTPRYGYEVPEEIESLAIDELFIECFDESLKLYSNLQDADYGELAEYATLAGHKNRWQFATDAKELKQAVTKLISEPPAEFLQMMVEKVSEHHPLIGSYIAAPATEKQSPKQQLLVNKEKAHKITNPRHRRRTRKPKK